MKSAKGIIILDKPIDMSSNRALQRFKSVCGFSKVGYIGTLDPLATGVLPICIGEATKFSQYLTQMTKSYEVEVCFGEQRETADAEGQCIARAPLPQASHQVVEKILKQFIGNIEQQTPRYSAIKENGQPYYRRARRGEIFEPKRRQVEIYRIQLLSYDCAKLVIEVDSGAGTYMRSLAEDIAQALDTVGYVSALKRLKVGHFSIDQAISFDEIAEYGRDFLCTHMHVIEDALDVLPLVRVQDTQAMALLQGKIVLLEPQQVSASISGLVRVVFKPIDREQIFVGLADCTEYQLQPKRLMQMSACL